ncbi:MAG: FAD-dependent oxidoreductase, partial [Burkholderiales bacterium]
MDDPRRAGDSACNHDGGPTMAAGPELQSYGANLNQTNGNVREVRGVLADIDDAIDKIELAIDAVDAVEDKADEFGDRIGKLKLTLKLMDKAGPLKLVAKLGAEILDRLQKVAREVEAKAHALAQEAEDAGVEVLWNVVAIGAVMDQDWVCGAVIATRYGPVAVLGQAVIDATGDGDVAAFAGAGSRYGATRDHAVMWYSLAQFAQPGRSRNNFTSTVDVSNIEDVTRAILAGRRRGDNCHDHGVYVAPRESRHILADHVLTLTDQL